jgi:hypothetical protein
MSENPLTVRTGCSVGGSKKYPVSVPFVWKFLFSRGGVSLRSNDEPVLHRLHYRPLIRVFGHRHF